MGRREGSREGFVNSMVPPYVDLLNIFSTLQSSPFLPTLKPTSPNGNFFLKLGNISYLYETHLTSVEVRRGCLPCRSSSLMNSFQTRVSTPPHCPPSLSTLFRKLRSDSFNCKQDVRRLLKPCLFTVLTFFFFFSILNTIFQTFSIRRK